MGGVHTWGSGAHGAKCWLLHKDSSERRIVFSEPQMLSDIERLFLKNRRVAHLATADRDAAPHVVPVCFAICNDTLVVDRYEEDWGQLGWVMLRGHAEILIDGREHDQAQALLRSRYPQLKRMQIAELPVIAVRIVSATSWGNLSLAK